MKISGWFWLSIGIAMSLFSLFVQSKNNNSKLILFLVAGIAFIVIGLYKLIRSYLTKDDENPAEAFKDAKQNQGTQDDPNFERVFREKQMLENKAKQSGKSIIACPRCGTRHYETSNFCHLCGQKLK